MKFLLILFAIAIVFVGIYGADYFSKTRKAGAELDRAVVHINENEYAEAIEELKNIIAQYNQSIVRAPALYLLAETYEKMGNYRSSLETHRLLITDDSISRYNNWYIRSVISVSKLYRNSLISISEDGEEPVQKYIVTIKDTIALKERPTPVSRFIEDMQRLFFSSQSRLFPLQLGDRTVLKELKTELGFLYLKVKKYELAEATFREVDSNAARFGLAQVYFETGNYDKGMSIIEELLIIDATGKVSAYYMNKLFEYAEILFEKKRYSDSIALYQRIIEHSPNSIYAELSSYKLATYYYSRKDFQNAMVFIEKTMKNNPREKDEDAYLLKGFIYYDKRDFVRALKVFNNFPKRYPGSKSLKTAQEWKSMCERSIKYLG